MSTDLVTRFIDPVLCCRAYHNHRPAKKILSIILPHRKRKGVYRTHSRQNDASDSLPNCVVFKVSTGLAVANGPERQLDASVALLLVSPNSKDGYRQHNSSAHHCIDLIQPSKHACFKKKRPLHSEDPPSPKRARARSSHLVPAILPTPDDSRSIASSAAPSPPHSAEVEYRTPVGPACPSVIRNRDESTLSRLPPSSDVFETFAKLKKDSELSDEEAFLKFITTYDVRLETLNRISGSLFAPSP
jgi:hypothetical protein